jgi:hypothetical protein
MEELSTLNVRLTFEGNRTLIFGLYLQFLELIKDHEHIRFSSIDYNNTKDKK